MKPDDLPDRVHIEALREALWRPESRAAVLVGAGMSRNADKLSPAVPDFPLWWDIAAELRKTVDPKTSEHDALRLGQLYENTYGRARLDDMLLELVPDGKYEPGPLHQRLLHLPWADVFTTNYDTLLERARRSVPERKYEIVEAPADLTRAERPRIVKLHGSFPARRPFIFTEEDYRRYPTDFAPFVNLVRQSAMENVLCLVGFSGSDPNFLQWAGWIRDQLGSTAPKIYLCGVLDLTTPKRSYYQHMQVIPVDLGPLFPQGEWVLRDERQRAAFEWLMDSLRAGEPLDRSRWPKLKNRTSPLRSVAPWPPVLAPPEAPDLPPSPKPPQGKLDHATLTGLLNRWKIERSCYPGWAVCPDHAQSALWNATNEWFVLFESDSGIHLLDELPVAERIGAIYEISWRAETALLPLPSTIPLQMEKALESINPHPILIDLSDASLTPNTATESLRWDDLTETWVNVAFSLVRHAWQFQDTALHERWMKRLLRIAKVRSSWRARWWYSKCWHHLVRLETSEALRAVRDWPEDLSLPFWEAKRAAVLGDLGLLEEARQIATRAMERVRLGRDRTRVDYQSLSAEGWILLLHHVLTEYAIELPGQEHEIRQSRLRELARDRCNPWDDLRRREHTLIEENPGMRRTATRGFDPGRVHYGSKLVFWQASEWALINTLHDGLKLRSKRPAFLEAMRRLWSKSPRLVLSLVIRAGAIDAIREGNPLSGLLDRAAIALLSQEQVDALYAWLSTVLAAALESWEQNPDPGLRDVRGDRSRIEGAAEVLSRLAFRLNESQLTGLFDLTRALHTSTACQRALALHSVIKHLLRRILYAATPLQISSWVPELMRIPVRGEPGTEINEHSDWSEPFWLFDWSDLIQFTSTNGVSWAPTIDRLLGLVREGLPETRKRAFTRLAALALAGALTQGQLDSFVEAIWIRTSRGYPADIGLPWVLLKLPERQPGETRRAVVRYFREAPLDAEEWLEALSRTTTPTAEFHEGGAVAPGIVWTPEEARSLLDRLLKLWEDSKPLLSDLDHLPPRIALDIISNVCSTLSTAIAPFLDLGDPRARAQAVTLAERLRQHGTAATCILPSLLQLGTVEPGVAATDVHRAVVGIHEEDVSDGVSALLLWLDLSQTGRLAPPPGYLLDVLVACVETGRYPGLTHTLAGVTALVSRKRPPLEARHREALERALGRLIETTALDRLTDDSAAADDLPLDAGERMASLECASALAAALATAHHAVGADEPAAITAWRELAAAHVLPEVRRPWRALIRA
ncbi:SIR2 family NAD-dependent protein deacylase [Sorangium sp. KYC3313]|uniref:SIR2 family NAD-dependent protein deacylase n=1 Tax=Sorangium sp. KYC3313 TaxID=3449740 RepID=UPI003F8AECD1